MKERAGFLRSNWAALALTAAVAGYGLARAGSLPERVASHFDVHGNPDRFSPKGFVLWFLPVMTFGMIALIPALVRISPQGYQMENSQRTIGKVTFALALLMNALQLGILLSSLEPGRYSMPFFISLSFGLFMVTLGNLLGKTERNFFIGIRTPWTLASDRNWLATHRFAGWWMVSFGILLVATSFVFPNVLVAMALMLVGGLGPVFYSYRFFRKREPEQEIGRT